MRIDRLVTAVDAHAAGEHGRVITGGVGDVPGATMFEKMVYLRDNRDDLRLLMLREPRGYPAANCNVLLPPCHPDADAGFVIMEQVEYPPMSGSNLICVATVLIETGMVRVREPVTELRLDTPAGLVTVWAQVRGGQVVAVTFRNVPAFAVYLDATVDVPGIGPVLVDVAWGGMFYVIADADALGVALTPDNARQIARTGEMIKLAARQQLEVFHPEQPDVRGITIAQLSGAPSARSAGRRNAVVVSMGQARVSAAEEVLGVLDRSPCGTGTCAKMATLHARGQLGLNEEFRHESVLGTEFVGTLVEETVVGPYPAVVPTISGCAWITALSQYVVTPGDPFPRGYTVGDLWAPASDRPWT
jgi:proline racemase